MPIETDGSQFLKERYDLHNSEEVDSAAERTNKRNELNAEEGESFERVGQDPASRIENYLNRFTEIVNREDPNEREDGIQALKRVLYDKFITKEEEIPESYWQFQERVMRERGQAGDWANASEEEKEQVRHQTAEALISDQRASLEQWIDYFASEDSQYLPDWMKYWVFRNVVGLQEYDKENHKFPNRSRGTLKQFPDINQEALAYVTEALLKYFRGEQREYEYDIEPSEREHFEQYLQAQNFAKLYGWGIEQINPISEELLQVTEGQWHKFDQGSDHKLLASSIRGRSTGWCTAGEHTAKTQLKGGDFYVYYSNDEEGNPTIPRVAIRKEGDKIAEVRGVAYKQNLDPYMTEVLAEKLEEFPDKAEYLKKEHDTATLTALEARTMTGEDLTKNDLVFLYELDSPIQGFGYQRDPRIDELKSQRNPEADMPIVFECDPSQIARSVEDMNENTKAFVGKLKPGVFTKIAELPGIEYLYTNFPEGKIDRSELTIGGKSIDQLKSEMKEREIIITDYAEYMLDQTPVLESPEDITTIRLKVGDLGFTRNPTTDEIYARAEELGLELCPAETGPHQRLKDIEQPLDDWYRIAMKQISDRYGYPGVFFLEHTYHGLYLSSHLARPDNEWALDYQVVFRLRKVSHETEAPKPLPRFEI